MAHGLGAIRDMRLDTFAQQFSEAGYACLVFDYRHFGSSEGEPRQLLSVRKQLDDWKAAVQFAKSLHTVDENQIFLWGTSFSGGHVLEIATQLSFIRGVVAQGLFSDGLASSRAALKNLGFIATITLLLAAVLDNLIALFGMRPLLVPLVGTPSTAALISSEDAYDGYNRLLPEGKRISTYVSARIVLDLIFWQPGKNLKEIDCPTLLCVCNRDGVAPAIATIRHAYGANMVTLKRYNAQHFDIYFGKHFEAVISDQITFLNTIRQCHSIAN